MISTRMPFNGTYSFKNQKTNEFEVPDAKVRIQRIDDNIARVFFVDDTGLPINPPPNAIVRDLQNNVDQLPFNGSFFVSWVADYGVFINGRELFRLINQKQSAVLGFLITAQTTVE